MQEDYSPANPEHLKHNAAMQHWSERLVAALKEKGWDYPDLARESGVPVENIKKYAQGGVDNPRGEIPEKLARALGKSRAWLMLGIAPAPATDNHSELKSLPKLAPSPYADGSKRDLPVRGGVMGGRGGVFVDNGEALDWVMRPSSLEGVRDAYAVYVYGDSMEPRYFAGEVLHVHPNKPVTAGAFVVVQLQPEKPGGELEYLIKRFVRRDAKRVVVEEYSPEKRKFDIPASRVIAIHRVVGTNEG